MESNQSKQNLRARGSSLSSRFSRLCFSSILICVLSSGLSLVACSNRQSVRKST